MKKTLKQWALAGLSLLILSTPVQAAQWKHFSDVETGLVFMTGDLNSEKLQSASQVSRDQSMALLQGPMNALQKAVAPVVQEQGAGVIRSLKAYTLDNPPRYEQLDSRLPLASKSNELLMKTHFINAAIETQNSLLPRLESQLKAGQLSLEDKAALALVTLSLGNFVSKAASYSQQVPGDLEHLTQQVTSEVNRVQKSIQANPMNALQMGPELQLLLEAQGALGKASNMTQKNVPLLPGQAHKLVGVMQNVQKLF